MRRLLGLVVFVGAACTEVATDPNAIVALRFEGSAYPSVVIGDSLRDSLGTLQPLVATALNYKNEPVAGADVGFSSPDTALRVSDDGTVVARIRKVDGNPARVFASVGALQSQPDSLFTVPRVDSMKAGVEADTGSVGSSGAVATEVAFTVFGDTLALAPKLAVQGWLVSFRLRYRDAFLTPTDTSVAYSFTAVANRRIPSFIDTTDATGRAARQVFLRSPRTPEDTIFLVATARQRKAGTLPITAETRLIFGPGTTTSTNVIRP